MDMLVKILYFINFSFSVILFLSFLGLSLDHWLHPFKKNAEATTLFLCSVITIIGMIYSVKYGYNSDEVSKGILHLFGSWLIAAMFLTIGLVFFNGSTK
jgi:hypothetical protein